METFKWVGEIRAVFWDIDGTLYKYNSDLNELLAEAVSKAVAEKLGLVRLAADEEFKKRYQKFNSRTRVLDSVGIEGRKFYEELWRRVPLEKYIKTDRRLRRMLEALGDLNHLVLTNSARDETKRKLVALGLNEDWFEKVLCTYEAKYIKPDVRAFKWALEQTSFKPYQVLTVGDREATDIVPAKKVGMKTCCVWGRSSEADVSLATVYEVAGIFGKEI